MGVKANRVYRNQQTNKLYKVIAIGINPENQDIPQIIYTPYGGKGEKIFVRAEDDFRAKVPKGGEGDDKEDLVSRFIQVVPEDYKIVETPHGPINIPETWRIAKAKKKTAENAATVDDAKVEADSPIEEQID